MPNNINYLGGGTKNIERPVEYYKTIDERKNEARRVDGSDKASEVFAKVLSKEQISNAKKQEGAKFTANKVVKSLEDKALEKIKNINLNKTNSNRVNNRSEADGTDLARMKKVAKELTDQVYGFLWAEMAQGANKNPEGGFGETIFQKSLWPELVKNSAANDLDEVGEAIVRDLIKQQENNVK